MLLAAATAWTCGITTDVLSPDRSAGQACWARGGHVGASAAAALGAQAGGCCFKVPQLTCQVKRPYDRSRCSARGPSKHVLGMCSADAPASGTWANRVSSWCTSQACSAGGSRGNSCCTCSCARFTALQEDFLLTYCLGGPSRRGAVPWGRSAEGTALEGPPAADCCCCRGDGCRDPSCRSNAGCGELGCC